MDLIPKRHNNSILLIRYAHGRCRRYIANRGQMKHLDLFSGIGGFALAASWVWGAEHEIVSFCEIEPFCQKVLNKHWPNVPIIPDIRDITLDTLASLYYDQLTLKEKEKIDMVAKRKNYDEGVALYNRGLSIQDVANFYGITRQGMWDILKRRGCIFRAQKKLDAENHFYRGGKTADDKAQNCLEYALRKGVVEKKTHCEKCGDTGVFKDGRSKIQAHHPDYNKPLRVTWLCQKCHHEWHKENKPIEKGTIEPAGREGVTLLTGGFP